MSAEWIFKVQTDAFTDESDYISGTRSTTSSDGSLMFNCFGGLPAIALGIGKHTEEYPARVRTFKYRIDKNPIVEISTSMTHGTFVFMQGEAEFKQLLVGIQAGQILTAEISDPREPSVRHVFSLSRSSAAIKKVLSGCPL